MPVDGTFPDTTTRLLNFSEISPFLINSKLSTSVIKCWLFLLKKVRTCSQNLSSSQQRIMGMVIPSCSQHRLYYSAESFPSNESKQH